MVSSFRLSRPFYVDAVPVGCSLHYFTAKGNSAFISAFVKRPWHKSRESRSKTWRPFNCVLNVNDLSSSSHFASPAGCVRFQWAPPEWSDQLHEICSLKKGPETKDDRLMLWRTQREQVAFSIYFNWTPFKVKVIRFSMATASNRESFTARLVQ